MSNEITDYLNKAKQLLIDEYSNTIDIEASKEALKSINKCFTCLEIYAEDKLNVDMLDKLHEVQDHVLNSGQTAVSMNQVQTAISLLECSLGVMGKVEE